MNAIANTIGTSDIQQDLLLWSQILVAVVVGSWRNGGLLLHPPLGTRRH